MTQNPRYKAPYGSADWYNEVELESDNRFGAMMEADRKAGTGMFQPSPSKPKPSEPSKK